MDLNTFWMTFFTSSDRKGNNLNAFDRNATKINKIQIKIAKTGLKWTKSWRKNNTYSIKPDYESTTIEKTSKYLRSKSTNLIQTHDYHLKLYFRPKYQNNWWSHFRYFCKMVWNEKTKIDIFWSDVIRYAWQNTRAKIHRSGYIYLP